MEITTAPKAYQKLGWLALMAPFCLLVSLPILQAGFFSDDITNSVIPGTMTLHQQGFWSYAIFAIQNWLNSGRLFPFSVLSSLLIFNFFPIVHDYQIIRIFFIWASIISFAWFVRMLTKNFAAALLFIFFMPLCWSIRNTPDPLTSFAIFLPLVVIFTAWTLIFYRYYQTTQKRGFYIASILMFGCGLCTYEIGIVAFFLVAALMYLKPVTNQRSFADGKPYLILLSVYLIVNWLLHTSSTQMYDGIQIHLGAQFWPAFFAQFTAAMPLSYYLFAPHADFPIASLLQNNSYLFAMVYLLLAGTVCIYFLLKQLVLTKRSCVCFSVMALFLMIIPAVLMGINQKYQVILHLGIAYIPIYLQYIGMGFILLAGFGALNLSPLKATVKRNIHLFFAGLLSIIITFATVCNLATVQLMNEKFKFTRVLVEGAARHGLLVSLPEQSYLIEKVALWNTPDFYMLNAHKQLAGIIDVRDMQHLATYDQHNNLTYHHKYFLSSFHIPGSQSGYVLLGRAKWAEIMNLNNTILTKAIYMTNPMLYVFADTPAHRTEVLQSLQQQLNLTTADLRKIVILSESTTKKWFITTIPPGNYRLKI